MLSDIIFCFSTQLIHLPTLTYLLTVRMSGEHTELENSIEEVLKKFMADKAMSEGVQASSSKGIHASPSTICHSSCVNPEIDKQSKH
jgi:hypothetical protein